MSSYKLSWLILDKEDENMLKKIEKLQKMVLGNLVSINGRLKIDLY